MSEPRWTDERRTIYCGDSLDILRESADAQFDACVTDPPYGLGFMGKSWDADVPSVETWREVLRVLKPGAFALVFAGTRTFPSMALRLIEAGFELRDCLCWLYGTGFPKSLDISKQIDRCGGNPQLIKEIGAALRTARVSRGVSVTDADERYCGGVTLWSWYEGRPAGQQMPTSETLERIANDWPELRELYERTREVEREILKTYQRSKLEIKPGESTSRGTQIVSVTAANTDAAKVWSGWGTALKPAWEPILLAMKPLDGTFAHNAVTHGVAGLNIDECRIGTESRYNSPAGNEPGGQSLMLSEREMPRDATGRPCVGRWPANVLLDEIATAQLDAQSDGASRFFYVAKPGDADRGYYNAHPTVKPSALMEYLLRLVATPTGGSVLDPFAGSGTTLVAAKRLGRPAVGIELNSAYCDTIARRLGEAIVGQSKTRGRYPRDGEKKTPTTGSLSSSG